MNAPSAARPSRLSDRDFRRAGELFGARCGLRFHDGNREVLEEGLLRAATMEKNSPTELLTRLEQAPNDALMQAVVRHVTIGETYFFRHPEHFEAVRELVVPQLVNARKETRLLRAWSAGCASGEEAYSIAMALKAGAGPAYTINVLGTDINKSALETARRGHYGRWSLRGALQGLAADVTQAADGTSVVSEAVRKLVRFEYLNLRDPIYPSLLTGTHGLDLIFCRNVLVYFFPEAATATLERMKSCLADGGWLVLSAFDVDLAPSGLEVVHHGNAAILRKQPAARTDAPRAPAAPPPRAVRTTPSKPMPPPMAAAAFDAARKAERAIQEAKAAADAGDLERAVERARQAVGHQRSPEALHLLALVLAERGEHAETITLLRETVQRAPDYVLGHLSLGLKAGGRAHLDKVLALLNGRRDEEMLPGPDPLPVSWVRKMAHAGLKRVEAER
jgi:chemotaxis protein methyltransferase CheR